MAAPTLSVSPWCTTADLPARATDDKFDLDLSSGGEVEDWIQVASDILFEFTRRRWPGATTATIRPVIYGPATEILLPNPPIVSITQVKIDGAVIASNRYRVDDYRRLVYVQTDGDDRDLWPSTQDLDKADSEPDTWSVTYVHGTAPPEGGIRACATLATELAISASPDVAGSSKLPARVTSITRQGVTTNLIDPLTLFDDAKTGIPSVDLWVSSVNLGTRNRSGRVIRLGQPRHRRST